MSSNRKRFEKIYENPRALKTIAGIFAKHERDISPPGELEEKVGEDKKSAGFSSEENQRIRFVEYAIKAAVTLGYGEELKKLLPEVLSSERAGRLTKRYIDGEKTDDSTRAADLSSLYYNDKFLKFYKENFVERK